MDKATRDGSDLVSGVCDTHIHFYGSRYPVSPEAVLRPPDATVDDYRAVQETLGIERVVVVQPTTYGMDNSCQADAIASLGPAARGVAVVGALTSDSELRRLNEQGFRGARFHMLPGGAVNWHDLGAVARRIAPLGWHIQLQMNGRDLRERYDQLVALPVPLVIDHVGRFMPPAGPGDPLIVPLLELMDAGAWLKLSAPYESAPDDSHRYKTVGRLIDRLVQDYPEQLLWASNWPHPGQTTPPRISDLAQLRDRWLPEPWLRQRVLVDNPERLYDF